jgi:hypothetical protein
MTMGVPQGGPLSTTLWNLFIEPLSRRLAAELPGVRVNARKRADGTPLCEDLHVTHLFFADDLAVPTELTHEAAQHALRITAEWGRDFGVAVNDGVGKTEAMHFASDPEVAAAITPTLPPLEVAVQGSRPLSVRWVAEYRYLGAGMRLDLDVSAALERRIATLDHIITRFFTYNSAISQLSCRAQLQLLNTLALGAVNYLLAVLPASRAIADKVDARIVRVGRRIFGAPRFCPPLLLALEMPGMPFYAAWVTHQVRLLETLTRLPLPDNLAVKLVAFQMRSQPRGHALGGTRYTPFVKRVVTDMDKLCAARGRSSGEQERRAIPRPAPATRHDIHHSVALFRRAHGLTDVLQRLPGSANVSARVRRLNVINATTRPLAAPVAQHLRTLYYGGQHVLPADLGASVKETPLSIAGPNCGGALLAMTSRNWRTVRCVMRLRMGALAFAVAPFHEGSGWRDEPRSPPQHPAPAAVAPGGAAAAVNTTPRPAEPAADAADAASEDGDADVPDDLRRRIALYSRHSNCPLCDAGGDEGTDDGPWHLALECMHPAAERVRLKLFSTLPHQLKRLLALIQEAHARSGRPLPAHERAEQRAQLLALLAAVDWYSADGKHAIFHLLTVLPWPARAAQGTVPATPLSAWLGAVFDAAAFERRHRRRIADHMVIWAAQWIKALACARRAALP